MPESLPLTRSRHDILRELDAAFSSLAGVERALGKLFEAILFIFNDLMVARGGIEPPTRGFSAG